MAHSIRKDAEPSQAAIDIISYNRSEIDTIARVSALKAIPICLAEGQQTTVSAQSELLVESIEEMIRRLIDGNSCAEIESVGIYKIEIVLAKHFGEGISEREKYVYQVDIDVSIPLDYINLYFHPKQYTVMKRRAKKLFLS